MKKNKVDDHLNIPLNEKLCDRHCSHVGLSNKIFFDVMQFAGGNFPNFSLFKPIYFFPSSSYLSQAKVTHLRMMSITFDYHRNAWFYYYYYLIIFINFSGGVFIPQNSVFAKRDYFVQIWLNKSLPVMLWQLTKNFDSIEL